MFRRDLKSFEANPIEGNGAIDISIRRQPGLSDAGHTQQHIRDVRFPVAVILFGRSNPAGSDPKRTAVR